MGGERADPRTARPSLARAARVRRLILSALALALALAVSVTTSAASGSPSERASHSATAPPVTVSLAPASATTPVGGNATVTATVSRSSVPVQNAAVTFTVASGPNAGRTGAATTDASGTASFTYASSATGTDTITASALQLMSNSVTVTWAALPKTDTKVAMSAPAYVRVGQAAGFIAVVSNGGPDTATGVVLHAPVPPGATLSAASSSIGSCTGGASVTCAIGTLAAGASATVTIMLSASGEGSLTLTVTVDGDYDTNTGNNNASSSAAVIPAGTPPPPPPPSSTRGTFNAVGTGTILVNGVPRSADQLFVLNSGDVVDVTTGIITFTDSDGKYGSWSSTRFTVQRETAGIAARARSRAPADSVSSKFQVQQPATQGAPTTLALIGGDFSVCKAPRSLAAKNKKPVRQLWGSAKGTFLTNGRFSAATVRGTVWFVEDRCDGTLTQVVEGVVDVLDRTRKKTVSVGPGQSYLALAPVSLVPPASTPKQTPAQVARRGLVWGARTYRHRPAFVKYLESNGLTWQQFAKRYPGLAAALAKRR